MRRTLDNLSQEALIEVAKRLAVALNPLDCLLLEGELGSGKTTFAGALIRHICEAPHVTSPTFTLVQSYPLLPPKTGLVWHYDLYRLEDAAELEDIALDEALDTGITLIEWPTLAAARLPGDALHITFAFTAREDYRNLAFSGDSVWMQRLEALNL
jgi:tRNA threonylcarbamoyl adenosine modification protein YjeE